MIRTLKACAYAHAALLQAEGAADAIGRGLVPRRCTDALEGRLLEVRRHDLLSLDDAGLAGNIPVCVVEAMVARGMAAPYALGAEIA